MKSTRFEASLPPPIVYGKLNRISWISALKRKKSVAPRSSKATLNLIYRLKNTGKGSKDPNQKSKKKLTTWKLINYLRPKNVDQAVLNESTIVENIERKSKRNIVSLIESIGRVKPGESLKRHKRSLNKNVQKPPIFLPALKNLKYAPKLAMFYRHPELSVEEQHQQLNQSLNEPLKSRTTREENRLAKLKTPKSAYTPVFKECDTTAASEVEDLNIPPPRPKYLKRQQPYIPDIDIPLKNNFELSSRKSIDPATFDRKPETAKTYKEPKEMKKPIALKTHSASSKRVTPKNGTYVNLRDHQEEAKKKSHPGESRSNVYPTSSFSDTPKYPKDIQPYNPDNIPYVEVPDYTDQREESLDEDDRRVAKERYRNGKDEGEDKDGPTLMLGSDDVVDPDAPAASDVLPDPVKNTERTPPTVSGNKATGKSESLQEPYKDVDVGREIRTESVDTLLHSDVLSRDLDDVSETSQKRRGEKDRDIIIEKSGLPGLSVKLAQDDETTEDDNEDGLIEDKSNNQKDDNSKHTVDFQSVHFDINDYIEPFDYDKLFAGEKKKSNDFSTDDSREESGSERSSDVATFPERFSERYKNPSENETFSKLDVENNSDEEVKEFTIVKPEEFYFGNKDFFKPISDEERKKSDRFISESDFLSRYFTDDIIRKLGSNSSDKSRQDEEPREASDAVKEETYKTLSTSLKQKDYIPKFEDDESKEVDKDKIRPREYNNFWTLEYTFPPEKINYGLRQERGESEKPKNINFAS